MNNQIGYIYLRYHESYEKNNARKLGKTINIPDRDSHYATGEIKRGHFEYVFEVPLKKMTIIEKLLQSEFSHYNIKHDAGQEFYNKKIMDLIEPYLQKLGVIYRKLEKDEISKLIRIQRIKNIFKKINVRNLINFLKQNITHIQESGLVPRDDQKVIIKEAIDYFTNSDNENSKGLLILTCGVGKTLISLWITQHLCAKSIIIGVPNILLVNQWFGVVKHIFPIANYLIVEGGIKVSHIIKFLQNIKISTCASVSASSSLPISIVITTYASSFKVYDAIESINLQSDMTTDFIFDMKINDEVHHLTSDNLDKKGKTFVNMMKIKAHKQLSLTATIKILENQVKKRDEDIIVSNDNVLQFGEIIVKRPLLWAIENNIICDYVIQTIIAEYAELNEQFERFGIEDENNKRMFLSAYTALKSIYDGHSTRLLIYSNCMDNCLIIINYIKMLLHYEYFIIRELFYSEYHSEMDKTRQIETLVKFDKYKYGIITCVYCLGEGYDNHTIDAVLFSENMSSNIRIVQSALRASRKNQENPDKLTKIILPVLHDDNYDWLDNTYNQDLKKVKEVIYQMGLEDVMISQKIKVIKMIITSPKPYKPHGLIDLSKDIGIYDEELTERLRLKTLKRTIIGTTYEKARKIIYEKNILSKEAYYELCQHDNRLTPEPEKDYKGRFTNWIDYLSIPQIYYDLETCKNKINEYLIDKKYTDINKYYMDLSLLCSELCKIDSLFPPIGLWIDYYEVKDLSEIIMLKTLFSIKKKKSSIAL
jgi:superfamily II DNA or RNA helicase